jgi:hypothetical protein
VDSAVKPQPFLFVWQQAIRGSDLTATQRLVAWGLSTYMDINGGSCFPGLDTIARATGLHRRTVMRTVPMLTRLGWLEKAPGGGRGRPSHYQATLPVDAASRIPPNKERDAPLCSQKQGRGTTRNGGRTPPDQTNDKPITYVREVRETKGDGRTLATLAVKAFRCSAAQGMRIASVLHELRATGGEARQVLERLGPRVLEGKVKPSRAVLATEVGRLRDPWGEVVAMYGQDVADVVRLTWERVPGTREARLEAAEGVARRMEDPIFRKRFFVALSRAKQEQGGVSHS